MIMEMPAGWKNCYWAVSGINSPTISKNVRTHERNGFCFESNRAQTKGIK